MNDETTEKLANLFSCTDLNVLIGMTRQLAKDKRVPVLKLILNMQNPAVLAKEVGKASLEFVKEVWTALCKQAANELFKKITRETLKLAVQAAWQCTKEALKQAMFQGLLVDGLILGFQVVSSGIKYWNGKVDRPTFHQEVICNSTTAVGSLVGGVAGTAGGAFIGGLIGSIFPVIGTSLGAMIGGAIGSVVMGTAGSYASQKISKKINKKYTLKAKPSCPLCTSYVTINYCLV